MWLFNEGYLKEQPKVRLLKCEQKVIQTFTPEHCKLIIAYKPKKVSSGRAHIISCVILDCGLRISEVLSLRKEAFDFDNLIIKVKGKGNKERLVPMSFELRKASGNLGAGGSAKPDLRHGEGDEVFPARRPVDEPHVSRGISQNARGELSLAEHVQQVMDLIHGQRPGSGIVDGRGQGFDRDVHDDPETEGGVLIECPLGPQHNAAAKTGLIGRACLWAVQTKQIFSSGEKVADLGNEFDYTTEQSSNLH
jgi:hypothetical protein